MKGKFLKFISLLCVLTVGFSIMVGCQGKDKDVKETEKEVKTGTTTENTDNKDKEEEPKSKADKFENKELNIAVFEGGYGREFWDTVVKKFEEAYPGVKINIEANPKIGDLVRPKMLSGNSPDFIYLSDGDSSGLTKGLIKDRGIMDITSVFEEMALDKDVPLKDVISEGFLETKKMSPYGDGKVYLAPFNYYLTGVWYNKNLFDNKGWEAPTTWDEFFAFQEKAEEIDRALFTYQGIYSGYLETIIHTSIASVGGLDAANAVFNHEVGAWKSDAVRKTVGVIQKMADDDVLLEGTVAMNHTQSQTEFMLGKALFCPNGTWFESEMKDAPREDGFEFGFLGAPTFSKDDQMYVAAGIEQMYIPKGAKNPELAKEFLKFLYTDESVIINAKTSKGVMAVKGAVETVKEYIPASSYNAFGIFDRKGAKPLVLNWGAIPESVDIEYNMYEPIPDIMNKDMTDEEWIEKMEKDNKIVSDAKAAE